MTSIKTVGQRQFEHAFGRMKTAPNRARKRSSGPDPQIDSTDWRATVNGTRKQDLIERILGHIDRSSDCWVWTARLDKHGYGRITVDGGVQLAHRVSYTQFIGRIPDGLEIDHICRNRACVNPNHLEAVTHLVNMQRRPSMAKAICINGHIQDASTCRQTIRKDGFIHRACRKCEAAASVRYLARKRRKVSAENEILVTNGAKSA